MLGDKKLKFQACNDKIVVNLIEMMVSIGIVVK